jgi:hypothetical protein
MANLNPVWIDDNFFTNLAPSKSLLRVIIHLDPQAGETNMADEFAATALGFYRGDPHRYALEQQAGRESQMDQAIRLINMWWKWQKKAIVHVVSVEKVLNQTAVFQIIRDWKMGKIDLAVDPEIDNRNIPLKAISPQDTKSKYGSDKLGRLQMHEPAFERGEIHLHISQRQLRDQLLFLGQSVIEHDDRADSFIGALEQSYNYDFAETGKKEYNINNQETIVGNLRKETF